MRALVIRLRVPGLAWILGALTAACAHATPEKPRPPPTVVPRPEVAPSPPTWSLTPVPSSAPDSLSPAMPALPAPVSSPAARAPMSLTLAPVVSREDPAPTKRPETFAAWIAALRRDAESGKDTELASHADLLAVIERYALEGTEVLSIRDAPDLEATERARLGRGTVRVTVATYVEPGAEIEALQRAHLDFDRIGEWTGHAVAKVIARDPGSLLVQADGVRRIGPLELGARWQFRVHLIERGSGRIAVTAKAPSADETHTLATHGLIVLFPEAGRVRVVETSCAAFDLSVPGFVRSIAIGQADREMGLRVAGIRAHWREYLR